MTVSKAPSTLDGGTVVFSYSEYGCPLFSTLRKASVFHPNTESDELPTRQRKKGSPGNPDICRESQQKKNLLGLRIGLSQTD